MELATCAAPGSVEELAARLAGRIATPADPDWDALRSAWNLAVDQRPELVAVPTAGSPGPEAALERDGVHVPDVIADERPKGSSQVPMSLNAAPGSSASWARLPC